MFIYSRTATIKDYHTLDMESLLSEYAGSPKPSFTGTEPRYKFWDYAIAFKVLNELKATKILDIGNGSDKSYEVLCNNRNLDLVQVHSKDFLQYPIRGSKYNIVTCFGILEHVDNYKQFLKKLFKHVLVDGALILTTDSESTKKNRNMILKSDDLINISFMAEDAGYEFYPETNYNPFEYEQSDKITLMSLVLKRVGK